MIPLSDFNQNMFQNMLHVYVSWTRYLLFFLMAGYTWLNFRYFSVDEERKQRICRRQTVLMLLLHFIACSVIFLNTLQPSVVALYGLQAVFFLCFGFVWRTFYPRSSRLLVNNIAMLLCVGFIMLARLDYDRAVRQFMIAALSSVAGLLIPVLINRVRGLRKLYWLYGLMGFLLLGAVCIAGTTSFGAQLTLTFGSFSLQPSEFVKILYVLFLAGMLCRPATFPHLLLTSAAAAVHVLVLVLSKDLGSALIFFLTYLFMLYAATNDWKWLSAGLLSGSLASVAAYRLFSHVQRRVLAWRDPWSDIDNRGYQITQSLFAIGTGGWFGLGLYEGMPKKIPVVEKDFIFAAISEEMGALFALCVLLLCLGCFLQFVLLASQLADMFEKLTAVGLAVIYIVQVFLTVGGVIKFIPSTGVTLPFVSYGGSSLLSTFLLFGVMQGLQLKVREASAKEDHAVRGLNGEERTAARPEVNRSTLRLTRVIVAVFAAMILYEGWFLAVRREDTINNSYNSRLDSFAERVIRGKISADDGSVLAETLVSEDGTETRSYPYGALFAHVVGYSAMGRTGLEDLAHFYLLSSHGNPLEHTLRELMGEKNMGDTVVTTLDLSLQQAAYDALGDRRGAVVALEPATGRVLAMVSRPGFDPNAVAENWEQLISPDNTSAQLLNRASQGLYPPGSTFKMVILLEYIREHPDDYADFRYECSGSYEAGGYTIQCYHGTAHGVQTLKEAFANSCNGAFAAIGSQLDAGKLAATAKELLFNSDIPVALPYSGSAYLMGEDAGLWERLQTAIGQGRTQITPLHSALLSAAAANGGVLMKPYFIDHIENAAGDTVRSFRPSAYGSLMTEEEAAVLTEYMTEVVRSGTASALKSDLYTAAGKTGSAEFESGGTTHAWFTGFAPAENPQLAVSVIVEEGGSGGSAAAPVAAKLFETYFSR